MVTSSAQQSVDGLTGLLSPEAVDAAIGAGRAPAVRPLVNAHVHLPPNFSAFESVGQALDLAAAQHVAVLGCSNYYDFTVYGDFIAQARRRGIFPLFGLEIIALDDKLALEAVKINDPGNPGKMYICGKGITRFLDLSPRAAELMNLIRVNDADRMGAMIAALEAIFAAKGLATGLTHDAVVGRVVRRHGSPRETVWLQERHVCQAFQEAIFDLIAVPDRAAKLSLVYGDLPAGDVANPVAVQNELRSRLMKAGKPAFVPERFVTPAQARELVLELGGIPCYPTLADGVNPICGFEETPETLIKHLDEHDFAMAEFIPLRNNPDVLERYVTAMRRAGLAVTAGTEHNTLDLVPIPPHCVGEAPIPPAVAEIFWEGACVVAAHQWLRLQGRPGFVDETGRPNRGYRNADARIAAFRRIGEALLAHYFTVAEGAAS
jgi:hypothetical protein